jgi:hypothetical protein
MLVSPVQAALKMCAIVTVYLPTKLGMTNCNCRGLLCTLAVKRRLNYIES